MADLDLRPLSLGEILDRTFSLYRRNFLLFVGITAIPQLMVLAFNLAQMLWKGSVASKAAPVALGVTLVIVSIVGVVVYFVAYLFAHGATVYAVSELYLGRPTSIGASLRRMKGQAGTLLGVLMLNGLATLAGFILLIIPGVYVACRLITAVPAALLEQLGPSESLSRSFALTKDNAGRAFVIYLLYFALFYGFFLLLVGPFLFAMALSVKNPGMLRTWQALSQFGSFFATTLVTPFFTIATAVFYYDLRVRKEAFDLQIMMNPNESIAPAASGLPSMLS
ncbi:MAG: glycerophosphoryl diester phosphodiesterase membrane domain-containing protein [Candidatus Acidiferrales bacterium]|jgi:glycerophosphoryl diester phosphodiesterase family protein